MTDAAERERLAQDAAHWRFFNEAVAYALKREPFATGALAAGFVAELHDRAPTIPDGWRAIGADDGRGLYGYWTDRGEWYCKSFLNAHEPINYGYTHFCPFPAAPQPKEPT